MAGTTNYGSTFTFNTSTTFKCLVIDFPEISTAKIVTTNHASGGKQEQIPDGLVRIGDITLSLLDEFGNLTTINTAISNKTVAAAVLTNGVDTLTGTGFFVSVKPEPADAQSPDANKLTAVFAFTSTLTPSQQKARDMSDEVKILTRDAFLKTVNNFKRELIPLQMGGAVYVAELSAAQALTYRERITKLKRKGRTDVDPQTSVELMALLISMAVCDEGGAPLFTEADAKALVRTNLNDLLTLSVKAMELSGLSNDAIKEVSRNLKKTKSASSSDG